MLVLIFIYLCMHTDQKNLVTLINWKYENPKIH